MEKVICKQCGFTTSRREIERLCSNCFACTGCERFVCPQCEAEIVLTPMQGFRLKKKSGEDEEKN